MPLRQWTDRTAACAGIALWLLAATPVSGHATGEVLLGFSGVQYEAAPGGGPDPTPGTPFGVGDLVVFVGHVTAFHEDLLPHVDPAQFEYTIVVSLGEVVHRGEFAPWVSVVFGGDIHVRVYEDAIAGGTPAVATADPPNTHVPSSFSDGTLILGGAILNLTAYLNTTEHTGGWGTYDVVLTDGTLAGFVRPPTNGKVYGIGGTLNAPTGPAGYAANVSGDIHDTWILPVEPSTWGALKRLYR